MKYCKLFLSLILILVFSCTPKSEPGNDLALRKYHDPSFGLTASLPVDWLMCNVPGGQFVRGLPLKDPTNLIIWTYKNRSVEDIRLYLEERGGVIHQTEIGKHVTSVLHWIRYRGVARSDSNLTVEFALATHHEATHLVLLVAQKSEVDGLVESVLIPAVESFIPGPPDPPTSVLAVTPPEPDYWPTEGWRMASPESQDMDPEKLQSMLALIRREKIPLDSLTLVRHGYVVLDEYFAPYEAKDLHELHSATKSVTSALLGIALYDAQVAENKGLSIQTPVLDVFSSRHADFTDRRKRAMTLEHLLTMTAGLDWTEWGAAYESGTGNDLVRMIESAPDWTQYILDRPMVADPGTTFLYNSGASHLLSAVVTELSGKPAATLAEERLFTPLGIHDYEWTIGPEGVTAGWANLRVHPTDLARIGLLYLQRGKWDGEQIIPTDWVESSTTDHVPDPFYEYGYQWWLDLADGYAFMAGRFGQVAIVAPKQDMVIVFTSHLQDTVSDVGVSRWLAERFILPSVELNT